MYLRRLMQRLSPIELHVPILAEMLLETWSKGGTVYVLGNGGSASTSQHFSADLQKVFIERSFHGKVISLNDNISTITMIANDYSFDEIFSRQLRSKIEKDDIVICISASGNSINVRKAIEVARELAVKSVGIVGFDGGWMRDNCSICLLIETDVGDYGVAEDAHLILCHAVKEYLVERLA